MNFGLIGYGYWGPNLAKNLIELKDERLIGICEPNPSRMERAKLVYDGRVQLFTDDYREILAHPEVDAVVIATPTEPSYHIAMDALAAGKPCFIEKPMASTVKRAENIRALAKKKGLIVHCDHLMIYNPNIQYIKNMIESGELGDLMYIDISRINLGPIRKDVNAMLDLAVHDIAVIDYLSGGNEPVRLSAFGQKMYGNQETITFLTLQYPTFMAHVKSSWVSPMKERRMMIAGSKKMVVFDDVKFAEKLTIYDHGFEIKTSDEYGTYEFETRTGDIFIPNIRFEDSLRNSLMHFAQCVRQRTPSLTGPEHSLRVMRILEKAMNHLRK